MKVLHVMVGLPRSGKSTKSKELGFPVVSPDSIRHVLYGTNWRNNVEPMIWGIAHVMVESLFDFGHNDVILDSCNVSENLRKEWLSEKWVCKYYIVDTPKDICIERAKECGSFDLIPVIERMSSIWDPPGMSKDC
jgi:predicted kinase